MKNRQIIETTRLILRPFKLSDSKSVQKYAGDFSVADTTLNIPHPYEDGMAEEWILTHQKKYEEGELINYAITLKPNDEIIGAVGLTINKGADHAELGYWIGKPFWNKGICTEAAKALIDYTFKNHDLQKISATYILRNPASGKVMQKIGMKFEKTLKDHVMKWCIPEDINIFSIDKIDWEKSK